MKSKYQKTSRLYNSRLTVQELELRNSFEQCDIPFESQKVFPTAASSFVIDFFLNQDILLEVTHTSMKRPHIAFRTKALQLQAKAFLLKLFFDHPMWVLFTSDVEIGDLFYRKLRRLMPSIDELFLTRTDLLKKIQEVIEK